ncbi:MAG TPA: hypothetical protein VHC19_02560, partial [Pirellulales bacterium]|nr:hypothetical protein [Pirellulales bacterium]
MEFLIALLVAVSITTVVGHGIWVLLAFVVRTLSNQPQPVANKPQSACLRCGRLLKAEQEHCDRCGQKRAGFKTIELADLEAVDRQLRRWRERGELKPHFAEQLRARVQAYRRKLLQPNGARPATAQNVVSPAAAGEQLASVLARRPQATEPTREAPLTAEVVDARPVKVVADLGAGTNLTAAPARVAPTALAPSPSAPRPEKPAAPLPSSPRPPAPRSAPLPPPAPRRTLAEMLTAFMEQRNIRWGELVGGLLIVCSSIALVSSLWDTLNTIPYFQFLIFVSASAAIFGAGLYTEHRWKLESTSRGILIIATLLVPLNFVAMAATARAGWDAFALLAELISLGLFAALVQRAARVLTPRWRWPLTWAVVGNSGLLLLARHQLSPAWLTVAAALAVACHGTAIGAALVALRRETFSTAAGDETTPQPARRLFGADRANELFILTGVSSFALLAALGLFVAGSAERAAVVNWFSPLVPLAALSVCGAGVAVAGGLKDEPEFAGLRMAGTTVALVGAAGMLAAQALGWPAPLAMLVVGVVNFTALSGLGLRCRLPVAHTAAIFSLAAVYVTGAHLALGHFAGVPRELLGPRMLQLAFGEQTAALLTGLFIILAAGAEVWSRWGRPIEARYYAGGCLATAAVSLSSVFVHAYLVGAAGKWLVLGTCGIYALGSLLLNLRWRQPQLSFLASALLAAGMIDAGFMRPAVELSCPWMAVCLAHASIVTAIGLACRRLERRLAGNAKSVIAEPLLRSAAASSMASLAVLPWLAMQPAWALALHLFGLAVVWLMLAVIRRSTSWFAAFQIALTAAILAAVTSWLNDQPWMQNQIAAIFAPRALQAYGIGLGLLCAAWSAARIALRRVPGAALFLKSDAAIDRLTFYGLSVGSFALAVWNALPEAAAELATGGAAAAVQANVAFGQLAWLLTATQALALLIALWNRWRRQETVCGVLLISTTAVLAAGSFAASLAVASALRWSLSGAFLFGSALVWLRSPLSRALKKLRCRCEPDADAPRIVRGLLLALCAAPVLFITGAVVAMQASGWRPVGPLAGSWFAALGFEASHLIPMIIIALTLLGHALRETSPGYAFSAGLTTNLTVSGGYALSVQPFGVAEFVAMLQLSAITAALWAIAWLASQRRILAISRHAEPPHAQSFLRVQLGLGSLTNGLLILPALGMLAAFSPRAFAAAQSWFAAAGSPLGWLALVSTIGASGLAGWQWRQRLRPETAGLAGMAALGLGACSIAWAGFADVWAYRALMLGWAMYAVSVVAAAWRATSIEKIANHAGLLESLIRSAALWVRIAGLAALGLGLKTAVFYHDEQPWAAAAIALASAACAAMAVWSRREHWAFIAGLGVNLAASIMVWHWHMADRLEVADMRLLLLQANLIAGGAVALVWLAARRRLYRDRLLSLPSAPLLGLQVTLVGLGNLLAIGIPLAALVMQPDQAHASLLQAGTRSGALAWLLGGAAVAVYCQKVARRELPHVLTALLLGAGVLVSGAAAWQSEPWSAYHALLVAWPASGFVLLAASLFVAPRISWLKPLARSETTVALMTTIETLVAALALRGAWDDPERPYWSLGAALSASLLAAVVAVAYRKPDHKYASGALLHLAIVLAGAAAVQHATVEFWLLHLIALGFQAVAWSLAERRLERERAAENRGELPAFRYAAAGLGVGLLCATVACNVLRAAGWLPIGFRPLEPFTFQLPPDASPSFLLNPLAWIAWGASAAAISVMLRDTRAVFRWEGAYSIGLAGICLAVERSTSSPLGLVQGLALCVSGYLLVVAVLEQFSGKLNLPGFRSTQRLESALQWLDPTQLVISLLVAGASLWLVLNAVLPADRLPGCLAAILLFAAALLQAREPERQGSAAWRSAAFASGALGAAELGWTWLTGEGDMFWLQRKVIAAAALFLAVLAGQFVVPKLSRNSPAWIESARRASMALGGLLLPLLAALLIQEWRLHVPGVGVPMGGAAFAAMAAMLAGTVGLALRFAVSAERDPLRLSLRGRTVYVYAAELFALLIVFHFRTVMPQLLPISFLGKYWTLVVMVVAFAGAALSEFFQRRKLSVLSEPLGRT